MKRYSLTTAFLSLSLVMMLGCGKSDAQPTASVEGFVTLNGQPFTGAAVHFYNPERGGGAFNLDADGKFVSKIPLPVGEYMVSLDRPGPIEGDSPADVIWPENKVAEVPPQYRSARQSGFVARVSVDGDNHFMFAMTGQPKQRRGNQPQPTPFQPITMN